MIYEVDSYKLEYMESEENIYNRAFYEVETTEEVAIKNIERGKVNEAMNNLTDIQKRRIGLHFFNNITIRGLAKLGNVQKSQIEKSLKLGMEKLRKSLKNGNT